MVQPSLNRNIKRSLGGAVAAFSVLAAAGCGNNEQSETRAEPQSSGESVEAAPATQERPATTSSLDTQQPAAQETTPASQETAVVEPAGQSTEGVTSSTVPVEPIADTSDTFTIEPLSGMNLWKATQIHYEFARSAHTDIANAVENVVAANDITAEETVRLASNGKAVELTMPPLNAVEEATGDFDWTAANRAAGFSL